MNDSLFILCVIIVQLADCFSVQECEPNYGRCIDTNLDTCDEGQIDERYTCSGYWGIKCCKSSVTRTTPERATTASATFSTGSTGTTTTGSVTVRPQSGCGLMPENRIVGGRESFANRWPWMVSIQQFGWFGSVHHCGAALISDQWIITAAHCLERAYGPKNFKIRLGEHNQNAQSGTEMYLDLEKYILHEDFSSKKSGFPNDIALMKLSHPVQFNRYIQPVCLPNGDDTFLDNKECWITGWGLTKGTGDDNVLNELRVDISSNEACGRKWAGEGSVNDGHVCIGDGINGSCQGDSGGPLSCKVGNRWVLAGVTSWGDSECNAAGFPDVYSRISYFLPWIQRTILNN
ncbi:unnamed protein product [Owenia fusiformis]|uniref:Uncharacterized protein n=1 Tax=Owenia fusiformis TaxID=6347 RepID=A0A8J1Y9U3_OWEFU|nr:unnamed protein product [Owenia fusiformis]